MIVHTQSTPTRPTRPARPGRRAGALVALCFAAALLLPLGGAHAARHANVASNAGMTADNPQMECSGISVPC